MSQEEKAQFGKWQQWVVGLAHQIGEGVGSEDDQIPD